MVNPTYNYRGRRVDPHDTLCQSHKVTSGDGWESHEVKVPDKMIALQTLGKMCNWFSPEKFALELGAMDSLKRYLTELRQQKLGDGMFTVAGRDRPVLELELAAPPQNGNGGASRSDVA